MKLLCIGDSWSAGVVGGNGDVEWDERSWPVLLGIDPEYRQAKKGSTANQWANDFDGNLMRAIGTDADMCILSIGGNDAMASYADGKIDLTELFAIISGIHKTVIAVRKIQTIVILYAPFDGRTETATYCAATNSLIRFACPDGVEFCETSKFLTADCFCSGDIHPNAKGHSLIAEHLKGMMK